MAYRNQFSTSANTASVVICSAPGASTSRTIGAGCVNIANRDTAAITVTMFANVNGTAYVQEPAIIIGVNESWSNDKQIMCLDATNETLEIYLAANVTSTQAAISVIYRDEGQ